jgi:hypothetical protein
MNGSDQLLDAVLGAFFPIGRGTSGPVLHHDTLSMPDKASSAGLGLRGLDQRNRQGSRYRHRNRWPLPGWPHPGD